jgi:predicted kinase
VADRIRDQQLHGVRAREVHESAWAEAFEAGFHERVYAALLHRADCALGSGRAVVIDGCFAFRRDRAAARSLALRHGVPFRFVECRVDSAVQRTRLAERDASSARGGWRVIARDVDAEWQPVSEIPDAERVTIDTSGLLAESLACVAARIPIWPDEARG